MGSDPPAVDDSPESIDSVDPARAASLALALVPGIGPRLRKALVDRFGSAEAVLAAAPSDLRGVPGIGPRLSAAIALAEAAEGAAEFDLCRRHQIDVLTESDAGYPRKLREIPDPPGVLFLQGGLAPQDELAIAIVGSRHATQYGLAQAERLAGSLARAGLTIVSGLARGIDGAAHRGALAAGGRTIAVLGSGLLRIYPPEHKDLADEVAGRGALLTEAPPRAAPLGGVFPQRNRIISALALGVIVVEAAERSGALITARHAMEQNRDVFAVPGRVDSRMSRGPHRLIRDGAKLVETADDVLEELGPLVAATTRSDGTEIHHPAELLLNETEQQVLSAVRADPTTIDEVIAVSRLPTPQVLSTLSVLEMRRLVRRSSGSTVLRP
jgi:DNA processing protein